MTPAKGYTEMKNSGIEWISQIPPDWEVKRLKELFSFGKGLPITKADLVDSGVAVINYGQIHAKSNTGTHLEKSLLRYVPKTFLETNPSAILRKGDIVFADTSEDLDGLGNAVLMDIDDTVFAGYHTIILHPSDADFSKYLSYLFQTDNWRSQLRANASGIKVFSVTQKMLRSCNIILPPKSVRDTTTAYLDTQCAKIDEIIAQAKASIEDYKQWKMSVVNDAVTHGLDLNAEMKDSGIYWMGKIPTKWGLKRLKYIFAIKKDIAGELGHTVLAITQQGIKPKNMSDKGQFALDYSKYQLVAPGDFAMNHMDLITGWVDISQYSGVTSPDYRVFFALHPAEIDANYYKHVFQTCYRCRIFYGLGQGVSGLGRWRLPAEMFLNFVLPVPPLDEQRKIGEFLDKQCAQIDDLIVEKQSLIDNLESYKKSLIYEVVTGKRRVENISEITISILSPEILRYRKALLMLRVLDLLGDDTRGRIQLQKCMFAAECLLNMPFHTQYVRYKHGPYDPQLQNFETILSSNGWYTVLQGSPVTYKKGNRFEEGLKEYMNTYSDIDSKLKKIVGFLRPMKTSQAERVATLLAVWNDFLLDGTPQPTDKEIIDEVVTHWTPNKANPQYSTWQDTLRKMRENQFIPIGVGVHTLQKKS